MQAHSHLRGRRAETDTMLARAARLRELACALFLGAPIALTTASAPRSIAACLNRRLQYDRTSAPLSR
jgi:hypothetical protein